LTFISYIIIKNDSVKNSISNNENNIKIINKNIEQYIIGIGEFSFPQFKYESVISAIDNESFDYTEQIYLEDYIKSLFYSREDIESIYIYIISQHKYYYIERNTNDIKVKTGYNDQIARMEWYKNTMSNEDKKNVQSLLLNENAGYFINESENFLAYHSAITDFENNEPSAMLSVYFNTVSRNEILSDIILDENEHVMLLDSNNVPYYFDDYDFFKELKEEDFFKNIKDNGKGNFTYKTKNSEYLTLYNISNELNWKLIKFIKYDNIYKAAKTSKYLSFFIGFIYLIFSISLIILTSNAITTPIKKLAKKMNRFGEGNFNVEVTVTGNDEIAQLSRQFNKMAKNTNDLINEQYKMKLTEKNAILKALESEINPHFLYNSLQSISTIALKNKMYDISNMVDALALSFRYCINGKDIVKIEDEIKHVKNYEKLQKARFRDRLNIEYDIRANSMEFQIPKLTIQTLVENSIKHVLEKTLDKVIIIIKVYKDKNYCIIEVSDNGSGIDFDKLEIIKKSFLSENFSGNCIGLKNLNTRLKLIFGERTKIYFENYDELFSVKILLPIGGIESV
jgi:two-component system sensor histidine kinase YesM